MTFHFCLWLIVCLSFLSWKINPYEKLCQGRRTKRPFWRVFCFSVAFLGCFLVCVGFFLIVTWWIFPFTFSDNIQDENLCASLMSWYPDRALQEFLVACLTLSQHCLKDSETTSMVGQLSVFFKWIEWGILKEGSRGRSILTFTWRLGAANLPITVRAVWVH